ncbi:hypothetical protein Hypma_013786 [Hypsizygus marmoreus]|uniref:F-box domain-containing protein n=1 Tax=Hypsizygus marmoreus TaxID=39966 RepID=A0A369KAL8_HYPMA|nr:hypothetical protein Hypma_013786 [Hypsizygus marmoreus]
MAFASSYGPPQLPSEIQEGIIDELQLDLRSLSTCALVSKRWLIRARHWALADRQARIIACTPNLADGFRVMEQKQDSSEFLRLLHSSKSALAPYIRNVLISGPHVHHSYVSVLDDQANDYRELNARIIETLPLLSAIRSITISDISWDSLQPEAKAVIASLRQVTSVFWKNTVFGNLDDLMQFCDISYPNLQKLKVRRFEVAKPKVQGGSVSSSTAITFHHLRLLDVDTGQEFHPFLSMSPLWHIRPQLIETLCLNNISMNDIALIAALINGMGASLRYLALDIAISATVAAMSGNAINLAPVSLLQNTNLRTIEISTIQILPDNPLDTSWLQAIMSTIVSPQLEAITLWVLAVRGLATGFGFRAFESSLVQRTDLLKLATVRVKFTGMYAWRKEFQAGIIQEVEEQLPVLHERGLLHVDTQNSLRNGALDGWTPPSWSL